MTREERELTITYLEEMKENYIEGEWYERHPLPEYYAIECAIKALEQEPKIEQYQKEIDQLHKYITKLETQIVEQEPTVNAIPLDKVEQIREEIKTEILSHSGTGEEVIQAYVDGLNHSLRLIDKAIKEVKQ